MLFRVGISSFVIVMLFIMTSSFSYTVNYFTDIVHTFNSTSNTYEIYAIYGDLLLYASFAWVLEIVILLVLVGCFFYKNICSPDTTPTRAIL
jgi:hypothetical protein